jgi:hypothetical protein
MFNIAGASVGFGATELPGYTRQKIVVTARQEIYGTTKTERQRKKCRYSVCMMCRVSERDLT